VDTLPVFVDAHSLKMLDSFTGPDLAQNLGLVSMQFRRDNQRHWLANDFFRSVAKQPLRTFVPAGDDSVQVLAGDCIFRRFDDRRQTALCFFSLTGVIRSDDRRQA
jgi:hypothetical protein